MARPLEVVFGEEAAEPLGAPDGHKTPTPRQFAGLHGGWRTLPSKDDHSRSAPVLTSSSGFATTSLMSSTSSPSAPGSTGRFSPDELRCFRERATPSPLCGSKSQTFWDSMGPARQAMTTHGLHTLPVMKGDFWHPHPQHRAPLADCATRSRGRSSEDPFGASFGNSQELSTTVSTADTLLMRSMSLGVTGNQEQGEETHHARNSAIRLALKPKKAGTKGDRKQPPIALPQEQMTAHVLEEIFPKTGQLPDTVPVNLMQAIRLKKLAADAAKTVRKSRGRASTSGSISEPGGEGAANQVLLNFRNRLLDKFPTIKDAFNTFTDEAHSNLNLSRKEWRRKLQSSGLDMQKDEQDQIFAQLDVNKNGNVTMREFHVAIEGASPVKTIEDLRRRWIASDFKSMQQAIDAMYTVFPKVVDGQGTFVDRRLTLSELGLALCKTNVTDPAEHQALFHTIHDPADRTGRVTIGELGTAIATVSPALLLEELRDRLLRKWGGLEKAFWEIDLDRGGVIDSVEFVKKAQSRLGLPVNEAEKCFRQIDIDGSGEVSKGEWVSALQLSEASLWIEDLRKKIRQRFRSIQDSFREHFELGEGESIESLAVKLKLDRFQQLLGSLELDEKDTKTIFELIDVDKDGELSITEFSKGIRMFAPSCVLEDLRMKCLSRDPSIVGVFDGLPVAVTAHMDRDGFKQVLKSLNLLKGIEHTAIFDLLDCCNDGMVTLTELKAALLSGAPGSVVKLSSEERNFKARQTIRGDLAPVHRLVKDLKDQVRLQPAEAAALQGRGKRLTTAGAHGHGSGFVPMALSAEAMDAQAAQERSATAAEGGGAGEGGHRGGYKQEVCRAFERGFCDRGARCPFIHGADMPMATSNQGARDSFSRIFSNLKRIPGEAQRALMEKDMSGYLKPVSRHLYHDLPLMAHSHSKYDQYKSTNHHLVVLQRGRPAWAK